MRSCEVHHVIAAIEAAGIRPYKTTPGAGNAGEIKKIADGPMAGMYMLAVPAVFEQNLGGDTIRDSAELRSFVVSPAERRYYAPSRAVVEIIEGKR